MPALLSVDEVYVKFMYRWNANEWTTNKILELEYNENSLELIEEWDVQFTYAHGIHFDEISGNVFAVSKTTDFIAKFDPNQVQVPFVNPMIASMDSSINTNFNIEPRRLWPIMENIHICLLLVVLVIGALALIMKRFLDKFKCGI